MRPFLSLMAIALGAGSAVAAPLPAGVLGRAPLCEASGITFVPCSPDSARCVLVADNERAGELYLFDVVGERLERQRPLPLSDGDGHAAEIKDAEGLAGAGNRVVVMGSHSRRSWAKGCTLDPERLAVGIFERRREGPDGLVGTPQRVPLASWTRALTPGECGTLLVKSEKAALAARVCEAIGDGQAHAEESADGCARGVNVEGVALAGGERIWLGLRGPTVAGKAVLLRLGLGSAPRFDAVGTVDLAGDGVRDLAAGGTWLWILAGPSADLMENGSLWRVPLAAVVDGAELTPTRVAADLPPFSEGVAIDANGRDAFVVIDGDEEEGPGDPNGCPTPARYLHLDLSSIAEP